MPSRCARLQVLRGPSAWIALCAALVGCGPGKAPDDLDALTHFLFKNWAETDPSVMEDGVNTLEKVLGRFDLEGGLGGRSFTVTPPLRSDLAGITWPMERNPADCIGTSVARESPWSIDDHGRFHTNADQLDAEPSASVYDRQFTTDAGCYAARTCNTLLTVNNITRSNSLYTVPYVLQKTYRWVRLGDDKSRFASAARGWSERPFVGTSGNATFQQSYAIDIFLGQPSGLVWRYQAVFQETSLPVSTTNDLQEAVVTNGVDGLFRATDATIMKLFHPALDMM